ncbi:hypothetical protein DFH06DRAFT_1398008 [Mycena polygramma]|nr:hypothetical protein DFH06DRAFT_1398008 [Mycena polygramma]
MVLKRDAPDVIGQCSPTESHQSIHLLNISTSPIWIARERSERLPYNVGNETRAQSAPVMLCCVAAVNKSTGVPHSPGMGVTPEEMGLSTSYVFSHISIPFLIFRYNRAHAGITVRTDSSRTPRSQPAQCRCRALPTAQHCLLRPRPPKPGIKFSGRNTPAMRLGPASKRDLSEAVSTPPERAWTLVVASFHRTCPQVHLDAPGCGYTYLMWCPASGPRKRWPGSVRRAIFTEFARSRESLPHLVLTFQAENADGVKTVLLGPLWPPTTGIGIEGAYYTGTGCTYAIRKETELWKNIYFDLKARGNRHSNRRLRAG